MGTQLGAQSPAVEAVGSAPLSVGQEPAPRWLTILDRIEHRDVHIGLRYWAPPIWLEVTMSGPDSDSWPASTDDSQSWDWQSNAACVEVDALAADGADDDVLAAALGRYTIENLILNAVHEIGEWFRFDGRRIFPPHLGEGARGSEQDVQGNGAVVLHTSFEPMDVPQVPAAAPGTRDEVGEQRVLQRLTRTLAAPRFTCLPGTTISYEAAGPVIRTWGTGGGVSTWWSTWSKDTVEAASADTGELEAATARDVHRALVSQEADSICRAFHIDGRRPWRLAGPGTPLGADPPDTHAPDAGVLSVSVAYASPSTNFPQNGRP